MSLSAEVVEMTAFDDLTVTAGETVQPLRIRKELVAVGTVSNGQTHIKASPTMRRDPYGYGVWLATTGDGSCLVLTQGHEGIDTVIAILRGYLSQPVRHAVDYACAQQMLATLQAI